MNRNDHITIDSWLPRATHYDDCYDPESARAVLGGLHGVDEQSAALTVLFYAEEAASDLRNHAN